MWACVAGGVVLLQQPSCCLLLPTAPLPHPGLWAGLEVVQRGQRGVVEEKSLLQ